MAERVRMRREFMSKRDVAELLRVDVTSIDRWRREGKFPEPIPLTGTTVRWRTIDVELWLREREREAAA